MSTPISEHGYLLAPVLSILGVGAHVKTNEIVDAVQECGLMRLFIVRDFGDNSAGGGMIEFENLNLAEKAYATLGQQILPSTNCRLTLAHPADSFSLRLPWCPPIEALEFPLHMTKGKVYDLFRPHGRLRYIGVNQSMSTASMNEIMPTPRKETADWIVQFYRPDNALLAIEALHESSIDGHRVVVRELESVPLKGIQTTNPYYQFAPFPPLDRTVGEPGDLPAEGPTFGPSPEALQAYMSCKLLAAVMVYDHTRARQVVMLLSGLPKAEYSLCVLNPFYLRCKHSEAVQVLAAREQASREQSNDAARFTSYAPPPTHQHLIPSSGPLMYQPSYSYQSQQQQLQPPYTQQQPLQQRPLPGAQHLPSPPYSTTLSTPPAAAHLHMKAMTASTPTTPVNVSNLTQHNQLISQTSTAAPFIMVSPHSTNGRGRVEEEDHRVGGGEGEDTGATTYLLYDSNHQQHRRSH